MGEQARDPANGRTPPPVQKVGYPTKTQFKFFRYKIQIWLSPRFLTAFQPIRIMRLV
jgi:hypothetical protein